MTQERVFLYGIRYDLPKIKVGNGVDSNVLPLVMLFNTKFTTRKITIKYLQMITTSKPQLTQRYQSFRMTVRQSSKFSTGSSYTKLFMIS